MTRSRRIRSTWMAGVVGAVLVLMAATIAVAADTGVSIVEQNEQYEFQAADVSVSVGDTVTWTNESDAPHTVTSDDAGGPLDAATFDEGETYAFTFDTAGTYAYHCEIHPDMEGTVTVAEASGGNGGGANGGGEELPPTDALGVPAGQAGGTAGFPIALLAIGGGALGVLMAASLRHRRERDADR